jgi:3-methyl-2-oxobutanoate hydroxymethyltransferase
MVDQAGIDLLLVGDSLGNVIMGYQTTLPVTLDQVCHHVRAVAAGLQNALLVADLPFGSYQSSTAQAAESAVTLMKAGAEAVKLEGDYPDAIAAIAKAGIPVMGHVGFTPQSVHGFGGFKVQGRSNGDEILQTALRLDQAGAFSIVLELMPAQLAKQITEQVQALTIGIGAGIHCDGEVQVWHDILGLNSRPFKHARQFVNGRDLFTNALTEYAESVRNSTFPTEENSF